MEQALPMEVAIARGKHISLIWHLTEFHVYIKAFVIKTEHSKSTYFARLYNKELRRKDSWFTLELADSITHSYVQAHRSWFRSFYKRYGIRSFSNTPLMEFTLIYSSMS